MTTHQLYDSALDLLRTLIRNACVNDFTPESGNEQRTAETLRDFFNDAPTEVRERLSIESIEPSPGRTTLVVTAAPARDEGLSPLTFFGHTDVVVVDEQHWTQPCFDAVIEDGKVYGRGAVDMLFITAVHAVVTKWAASQSHLRRPIQFAALADEEARGGLGAGWIAENRPDAISWENCLGETGGGHIVRDGVSRCVVVNAGEKGAAQRRIHVTGDPGHASAPWGTTMTTGILGEVTMRLASLSIPSDQPLWEPFVQAFGFDPETEEALISHGTSDYSPFGEMSRFAHAISHTTVAPTVVRAGGPINVLPSSGYVELDIRPTPGMSQDDVDEHLLEAIGELRSHCRIERLICEDATVSSTESPLYHAITETFAELFPEEKVLPIVTSGGSDLRFARKKGGVGYGFAAHAAGRTLGDIQAQLHAHDEHLHLEDLDLTLRAYVGVTERFAGV
nr:M20/M25/M40 family metallo-hydrolase [Corynebacterium ciconiae]